MIHFNEPHIEKTTQLVSYIVQFFSFINLIFHGSRRLLRLYNKIIFSILQPFYICFILLCLSENSSELMLFVNLNRHEIKFLVSCIDGPGRKPQSRQVFSMRGDGFENYKVHVCMFFF